MLGLGMLEQHVIFTTNITWFTWKITQVKLELKHNHKAQAQSQARAGGS